MAYLLLMEEVAQRVATSQLGALLAAAVGAEAPEVHDLWEYRDQIDRWLVSDEVNPLDNVVMSKRDRILAEDRAALGIPAGGSHG